jgi:dienelactone hydrolase
VHSDIEFTSEGDIVRGWFFTPAEGDAPYPAIVMAGGWCYVKELVQPHYAQFFVDAGFAVLLFDYRTFGSSDSARRQHIDPTMQIEDYRNAISYLETREDVDPLRIGVWGLSYSGGHALMLAASRPARPVRRCADSCCRRLPKYAARPWDDGLPALRAAAPG